MSETEGYAAIAQYLENNHRGPVLRRFGALNVQNLLYMQAELFHLEKQLNVIAKEDADASEKPREDFRYSMLDLQDSLKTVNSFQWKKILELREKLQIYNKALVEYQKLKAFPRPPAWETANIRHILRIGKHTKFLLKDTDVEAWGDLNEQDLVALCHEEQDRFTSWVRGSFLIWFHRTIGFRFIEEDPHTELAMYSDRTVFFVVSVLRCSLATLLPAISIITLYVVRSVILKFVLIFFFTAFFTIVISCLTLAKSVELFVAATTFATVQVVFVNTTN